MSRCAVRSATLRALSMIMLNTVCDATARACSASTTSISCIYISLLSLIQVAIANNVAEFITTH